MMEKFKEEKRSYEFQKEDLMSEIDEVRQSIIIAKSKNAIHEKKIAEYMKKIMELNNRKEFISSVNFAASNESLMEHPSSQRTLNTLNIMKISHCSNSMLRCMTEIRALIILRNQKQLVSKENMIQTVKDEKTRISVLEKEIEDLKRIEYNN